MAKRGGFPGGMGMPGNMNNLMKQAQRMQRQMEEGQKELETKEFSAKAGGGAVEVVVTGKKEIVKVTLSEEAVDPEDIETLQDMIMAAANEALNLRRAGTELQLAHIPAAPLPVGPGEHGVLSGNPALSVGDMGRRLLLHAGAAENLRLAALNEAAALGKFDKFCGDLHRAQFIKGPAVRSFHRISSLSLSSRAGGKKALRRLCRNRSS